MTITWEAAATPIDAATYRDGLFESLEAQGASVNGWSDDAPQRAFVEGEARALAAESTIVSSLAKTASPATCGQAGSSWVDAVMGWFNIVNADGSAGRLLATKAVWQVEMEIARSVAPITIDSSNASQIQVQAEDGTIFLCTQQSAVTLNSTSSYQGPVVFTARLSGTSGNVTTGTIARVISGPAGLSVVPSGTQTQITTARNDEDDAAYIARGLGKWGVIFGPPEEGTAGWTRESYDFLIPFYGNNVNIDASVTRWSVDDANPNGPGTVQIALADAAGPANAATVTAVNNGFNLPRVKPVGSGALTVTAAVAHAITITAVLDVDGTNSSVVAKASAALVALGAAFPLGPATLVVDLVIDCLMGRNITGASIPLGGTKTGNLTDVPGLSGFGSVLKIASLSVSVDLTIATGEVLTIAASVSVS